MVDRFIEAYSKREMGERALKKCPKVILIRYLGTPV